MTDIYNEIFNVYCNVVHQLCRDASLQLRNTKHERAIFKPRRVYTPQAQHTERPSNFNPPTFEAGHANDKYYLKMSPELRDMLKHTAYPNEKIERQVGGLSFAFPPLAVFELKYKLEKELPREEHRFYYDELEAS